MQGLRKIRARRHIVVCGAGNVGGAVVEFLVALNKRIVVIEAKPDPVIVELARDQGFDFAQVEPGDRVLSIAVPKPGV